MHRVLNKVSKHATLSPSSLVEETMEYVDGYRPWMRESPEYLFERRNLGAPGRSKTITIKHVVITIGDEDRYIIIDTDGYVWCFSRLHDVNGKRIATCLSQHVTLNLHFDDEGEILYATFIETQIEVVHTTSQR